MHATGLYGSQPTVVPGMIVSACSSFASCDSSVHQSSHFHRAPGEDFRALFPVQPTTQLTLWRDAVPERSITSIRLGGSDLHAWHGLWTDYGVTGSLFWRTPVFEVTSGWPTYRDLASSISDCHLAV